VNHAAIIESPGHLIGPAVLNDPVRNKGTAFTEGERQRFCVEGLLPPSEESIERQVERVLGHLEAKPTGLERYIYLTELSGRNETLFYRTVMSDPMRFIPILYDPTVAEACIMPGRVNPTQAEALTTIAVQVMANDVAVGFGGAGGCLEMNVYKPLMIANIAHSIGILTDECTNLRKFRIEGTQPNRKKISEYVNRSLILVTALAPVIGYDKASTIAHHALEQDLTLKEAALQLGFVDEQTFDRVVDPVKMVEPYVATTAAKQ